MDPTIPPGGEWKQQEPLGGGPVGESEWTRPEAGLVEAHGWRHQRTGWYYIETRPAHQAQFKRAIRTNCQPASQPTSERRMSGRGSNQREQVLCPKCGSRVQRQYMQRHNKNMGGRCSGAFSTSHGCPLNEISSLYVRPIRHLSRLLFLWP